ncbi:MAG: M18 family aminopeptidase [Eubacterium sp.]|nr:M18 family aminopeptidase [Eubacterium sp.]
MKDLFKFIKNSPSPFHAASEIKKRLAAAGFTELDEYSSYELAGGGKYFTTRNDSAVIAFELPKGKPDGFHIIAAHDDSPAFKIKEEMNMCANPYVKLNVEKYGGMILSTWFDRPLGVAGRVMVKTKNGLESRLYESSKDLVMIPSLAIHMERDINDGHKYQVQKELMPIFGNEKADFKEFLADELKVKAEDIYGSDLFVYNRQEPSVWGDKDQFVSAPKLDDLECVYCALCGFIAAKPQNQINVLAIFDNEEVGSGTKQGADSTFLSDTLERMVQAIGIEKDGYHRMLASSLMISADNAHGMHPNYPEKADETNRPYLNEGIVIKYNANQKYTTDAVSGAAFKLICEKAKVPYQSFTNRSDMAGGSTLGNISNSQVSVNTVDIGLAQWAMHSSYESAGAKDIDYLVKAAKTFYSVNLIKTKEGWNC